MMVTMNDDDDNNDDDNDDDGDDNDGDADDLHLLATSCSAEGRIPP